MSEINIPRLDLATYVNGTAEQRKQFSEDLGKAFNETGFVTITNHGLSKQLISDLYSQVKELFTLPEATKLTYEKAELAGQRGYTSKGKETAKGFKVPDLKEFWQIGQTVTDTL
jgi:isopenicillin N synthase-like dioxygenase